MNTLRSRALVVTALAAVSAGCTDRLLETPAQSEPVTFSVALTPSAAVMGGSADAFSKTDAAGVHLTAGSGAVLDTSVAIAGPGDRNVVVRVRLPTSPLQLAIGVNLTAGGRTLFVGTGSAQIARGHRTEAVVTLTPVVAGLVVPDSQPTITALGDTIRPRGAAVFATGDTVQGATLTWGDGGSAVARLRQDGGVQGLTEGLATLTATYPGGFTATSKLRVRAIVTTVTLTPGTDTSSLAVGGTRRITVIPRDRNGNVLQRTPTWQSSSPGVATVDTSGTIRGVAPGTTTITALIEGKSTSFPLTVLQPPSRIVVTPNPDTMLVADTASFQATAFDSQGRVLTGVTFTWSSSDTTLLRMSGAQAHALRRGQVNVIASAQGMSGSAQVTIIQPILASSTEQATFTADAGTNPPAQRIDVFNAGTGPLTGLSVSIEYAIPGPTGWLTATLTSTSAPATLVLGTNTANLTPGTYSATVVVSSSTRGTGILRIPVKLTITAPPPPTNPPSTPPPPPPAGAILATSTQQVTMTADVAVLPQSQRIDVFNAGTGALTGLAVRVEYANPGPTGWLTATLTTSTAPATLVLGGNSANLPQGTYFATVVVSSSTPGTVPVPIAVQLTINPPPPPPTASGQSN